MCFSLPVVKDGERNVYSVNVRKHGDAEFHRLQQARALQVMGTCLGSSDVIPHRGMQNTNYVQLSSPERCAPLARNGIFTH